LRLQRCSSAPLPDDGCLPADGLKPFVTRFGIHVGEAVVGNVGSTERMNYTALGNTVNLAARLEGLNKGIWDNDPGQ
jgi:class 3 adenylate cyclase